MSYYETQTVECHGIPCIEYRTEPEIPSEIQIEFTPSFPYDDFAYDNPYFVPCQQVLLRAEFTLCESNNLDWHEECQVFSICALEMVEPARDGAKYLAGRPYWMYGIRGTKGTSELVWFSEFELISLAQAQNPVDEF